MQCSGSSSEALRDCHSHRNAKKSRSVSPVKVNVSINKTNILTLEVFTYFNRLDVLPSDW